MVRPQADAGRLGGNAEGEDWGGQRNGEGKVREYGRRREGFF